MLTTLRIKNLALVEELTLELLPGYNVITGETGAGKSILIGALSLVLGERADRNLIRSGSDSCSVEAVFDARRIRLVLNRLLEDSGLDPCDGEELLLKRTFTAAGTNRQFVNGSPTTLNVLAGIGELLVDIHGPHEHQSLLHPAAQLTILDAFGKLDGLRTSFSELVRKRAALEAQKAELVVDEKTYEQQLDLLRFQATEIEGARLQAGEEETLSADYQRSSNSARLLQLVQTALDLLSEGEGALLNQAGLIGRTLQELQKVDPGSANLLEQHEQSVVSWRELQGSLSHYLDKIEVDPERLREMEERLNLIFSLKRKYGASVAAVLRFGEEARRKLQSLEQREAELARINAEVARIDEAIWREGRGLSQKRAKVIPQLSKAAAQQLTALGFRQSRFEIMLSSLEKAAIPPGGGRIPINGLDTVEFQFAPNPGEPAKPLRAIASSGELARVMLALKTVLAAEDRIPVLVFDEVDANVGGETARAVGEKMRQIARQRQVLCITHLPQVAAPASAHYVAVKEVRNGRTISQIDHLDRKQRVTELARMLGGQSEVARKHAEALIAEAEA